MFGTPNFVVYTSLFIPAVVGGDGERMRMCQIFPDLIS